MYTSPTIIRSPGSSSSSARMPRSRAWRARRWSSMRSARSPLAVVGQARGPCRCRCTTSMRKPSTPRSSQKRSVSCMAVDDLGVAPVEVGLLGQEEVQVPLLGAPSSHVHAGSSANAAVQLFGGVTPSPSRQTYQSRLGDVARRARRRRTTGAGRRCGWAPSRSAPGCRARGRRRAGGRSRRGRRTAGRRRSSRPRRSRSRPSASGRTATARGVDAQPLEVVERRARRPRGRRPRRRTRRRTSAGRSAGRRPRATT